MHAVARVRAHAGACVRESLRACVRDVFAIFDNNISPRLIMIIIKNIRPYLNSIGPISHKSDTLMISPQRVPGQFEYDRPILQQTCCLASLCI